MSYELDGIKTAMVEDGEDAIRVDCPCGWWTQWNSYDAYLERKHDLRFHFTHCTWARPATRPARESDTPEGGVD